VRDELFEFSQGSVETRDTIHAGEVENVYTTLRQIYSGDYIPSFITISLVCIGDITKKHFVSFFWTQCIGLILGTPVIEVWVIM